MKLLHQSILTVLLITTTYSFAANESNTSFSKAKKMLERQVYQDHRETIYCGAEFDSKK